MINPFKLTMTSNPKLDEKIIRSEIHLDTTVNDIYGEIVKTVAEDVKDDIIKEVRANMIKDKKLMADIQEEVKRIMINKILPEVKK